MGKQLSEGLVDDPNEELSAEEQNLVRALDQYAAKGKEDGDGGLGCMVKLISATFIF